MKTLNQHIQEKLIINKNYKSVSYDFSNVKELYLIRFFLSERMSVNIIDIKNIKMKYDNNYGSKCIVNGDFRLWKNCYYLNKVFKCDSTNGTLYRDDGPYARYCDVLIHESLKDNFKKFVEYISKNPHEIYSVNDIFDILNIKCPDFEKQFKVEYDHYDHADDPIFMDKLKKIIKHKMKHLSKYLAEKLIVNRNYRGLGHDEMNYDPEELVSYVLEHFEILPNNQTSNLSRLNKITSDEYDDLYDKIHHLFVDKFDFVKYKNIKFLASARCIELLDDDLQNSYNESDIEDEVWINDPKLLKTVNKFSIFYVYNESFKTIRIFYYKAINNITLVCDIDI